MGYLGEKMGGVGRLRVESLACIPVNLDLIDEPGLFQLWSSGHAASNPSERQLAMQNPGPLSQICRLVDLGWAQECAFIKYLSDFSRHSQVWKSVH